MKILETFQWIELFITIKIELSAHFCYEKVSNVNKMLSYYSKCKVKSNHCLSVQILSAKLFPAPVQLNWTELALVLFPPAPDKGRDKKTIS